MQIGPKLTASSGPKSSSPSSGSESRHRPGALTRFFRPRRMTSLILLHDSHTPPSVPSGEAWLRHTGRQMGLLEIGYHAIIERSGLVRFTRPWDVMGSHAPGLNHTSIGICLMGGEDEDGSPASNFTGDQMVALHELLIVLVAAYPGVDVRGHSEAQVVRTKTGRKRQCPMIDMRELRRSLASDR